MEPYSDLEILFEDNHLIIVNKKVSDIVQGDKTGDRTLAEDVKMYIKEKYDKPGEVFLGIPHRIDRPTSGIVVFARTSKALERLNEMFREQEIDKKYWAIVVSAPVPKEGKLIHYLKKNELQNKSYVHETEVIGSKKAILEYKQIATSEKYYLLEVKLHTGRHHQIRCQLATIGCVIKGDLKYGAARPNSDAGICLHARKIEFIHPVQKEKIEIIAPLPKNNLWDAFEKIMNKKN